MTKEFLDQMNAAYSLLEKRRLEMTAALTGCPFELTCGWYSGHYRRQEDGTFREERFPIPVISVTGCCDIEIGFDMVNVTAKLSRADALAYSFEEIGGVSFEAYGVREYLTDSYHPGMSLVQLRENIGASSETEFAFGFQFASTVAPAQVRAVCGVAS